MTSVRLCIRNTFIVEHPSVCAPHPSGRLAAQQKISL